MATRKTTAAKPMTRKAPAPTTAAKATKPAAPAPSKTVIVVPVAPVGIEIPKTKHKLVRDSFTIPKVEYAVLAELKQRATRLMRPAKKGELLRAGIGALNAMSDKAFIAALASVPSLKTGRPKNPPAVKAPAKKA
jgi:hypothetical protein